MRPRGASATCGAVGERAKRRKKAGGCGKEEGRKGEGGILSVIQQILTEHLLCSEGLEETFCFRWETEAGQGKWQT